MDAFPLQLLKQVDHLNGQIENLQKEKQNVYQRLSAYKKEIEKKHSYLIGRRAMCIHIDNPKPIECVCTAVIALDDYESVKPLFSLNGKKYIIETYEWIN